MYRGITKAPERVKVTISSDIQNGDSDYRINPSGQYGERSPASIGVWRRAGALGKHEPGTNHPQKTRVEGFQGGQGGHWDTAVLP